VVSPAVLRAAPSERAARRGAVGTTTAWGHAPVRLLVLASRVDARGTPWIRVRLAGRPNDAAAWMPAGRARVAPTVWRLTIDRATRTLRVLRRGKVVRRFSVVVGAPGTPTPAGLFAISEADRQPDPGGFLGTWALHLTAHSTTLENYGGGPGRVAIHGRAGASLLDPLGTARSHGCVRIDDRQVRWLATHVRGGTPVRIT